MGLVNNNIKNFVNYIDTLNHPNREKFLKDETRSRTLKECAHLPADIQAHLLSYLVHTPDYTIRDYVAFKIWTKNAQACEVNAIEFLHRNKIHQSPGKTAEETYLGYLFDNAIRHASPAQKQQVIHLKRNTKSIISNLKIKLLIIAEKVIAVVAYILKNYFFNFFVFCLVIKYIISPLNNIIIAKRIYVIISNLTLNSSSRIKISVTLVALCIDVYILYKICKFVGHLVEIVNTSLSRGLSNLKINIHNQRINNELNEARQLWINHIKAQG